MPYKSDAQRKYMHATKPKGVYLKEWDRMSKGLNLPEHVKKQKAKKK